MGRQGRGRAWVWNGAEVQGQVLGAGCWTGGESRASALLVSDSLAPARTGPRLLVTDSESLASRGPPPSLPSLCPRRALRGGTFCEQDLEMRPPGPTTFAWCPSPSSLDRKSALRQALLKASSGYTYTTHCIYTAGC